MHDTRTQPYGLPFPSDSLGIVGHLHPVGEVLRLLHRRQLEEVRELELSLVPSVEQRVHPPKGDVPVRRSSEVPWNLLKRKVVG
jgi:hypothetical protein